MKVSKLRVMCCVLAFALLAGCRASAVREYAVTNAVPTRDVQATVALPTVEQPDEPVVEGDDSAETTPIAAVTVPPTLQLPPAATAIPTIAPVSGGAVVVGGGESSAPPTALPEQAEADTGDQAPIEPAAAPASGNAPPVGLDLGCRLGSGIRIDNADLHTSYTRATTLHNTWSGPGARQIFSQLQGIRAITDRSVVSLEARVRALHEDGIPFEAIGYDLEDRDFSPVNEQENPIWATQQARDLADELGKQFMFVPALAYMEIHWAEVPGMAANVDVWIVQAQRLQRDNEAGQPFRDAFLNVYNHIKSGNPNIEIWVQLSAGNLQERTTSDEIVAHYRSIEDLVGGLFIFDKLDLNRPNTLAGVYEALCSQ